MAYEYEVQGQTVRLEVDPSVVAVRFEDELPNSARADSTERAGAGPFSTRLEIPDEQLTIVPVGGAVGVNSSRATIDSLNAQPEVRNALPVFRLGGNQVVATERVIVGINDPAAIDQIANENGMKVVERHENRTLLEIAPGADVFEVCKQLSANAAVRYAEPDFVTIGRHVAKRGKLAPLVAGLEVKSDQYALAITKARAAQELQKGDPSITIAVLDEGVDTRHPDLLGTIAGTYDGTDNDTYQEPNAWDGHGTACAGLALAAGAAAGSVDGIGKGCSCFGVRIAFSKYSGGPWQTTNAMIARSIEWSWKQGASVLSNSWGNGPPSNAIADEFVNAREKGRGGKGCVVIIAAGNSFSPVQFPATLPGVIAVSASNEYDEIKTPTSKDGETWWGTCHGPQIWVAAPGVHNLTTDISGAAGYDGGNYTPNFNGTSSATPLVAGACGLVLSANPALTEAEVRQIIADSADKVGDIPYDDGRNDMFGFGRLNVLAAVEMAKATVPAF